MDEIVKLKSSLLQAEERLVILGKEREAAVKDVARLKENNQRGAAELQKAICSCLQTLLLRVYLGVFESLIISPRLLSLPLDI